MSSSSGVYKLKRLELTNHFHIARRRKSFAETSLWPIHPSWSGEESCMPCGRLTTPSLWIPTLWKLWERRPLVKLFKEAWHLDTDATQIYSLVTGKILEANCSSQKSEVPLLDFPIRFGDLNKDCSQIIQTFCTCPKNSAQADL